MSSDPEVNTFVVTGTSTGVGKTVVTAAWAALARAAGQRVAVVKLAQTGTDELDSDVDEVRRLTDLPKEAVTELATYPEPLAPSSAARRSGRPPLARSEAARAIRSLAAEHDLVLVEGAGGVLVPFADPPEAWTLAGLAADLGAPALVVAEAGLGTLNHTALTIEALGSRGVPAWGVVIGAWPEHPGLAERCNLEDLGRVPGSTLVGALPAGAGARSRDDFADLALAGLAPLLGGRFDAADFVARHAPPERPSTRDPEPKATE